MNWRKGAYALAGGVLGFLIVLFVHFWTIGVAIQSMGFFGSPSFTGGGALIFYFIVPLMMIAGAVLTAKSLEASWNRSLAAGAAAFASVLVILYAIPAYSNYSPFNQNETLTLVCPVVVTVLISILGKNDTNSTTLTLAIGLSALLIFYSFVFTGYGLIVAAAAWLLIPLSVGLSRQPDEAKAQ
jgi:hypothetical protein